MLRDEPGNRATRKMCLTLVGLCLLLMIFIGNFVGFLLWKQRMRLRIRSGAKTIETAAGLVEYQTAGQGPALLFAHGTPGGYEQGIAFRGFLQSQDYLTISPSRPGYLRTPLSSGSSPAEQADLYAALLDSLGIEKASVLGFSGGSPSALQFAFRYPERCQKIIIISGISQHYDKYIRLRALPPAQRQITHLVDYLLIYDPFLYIASAFTRMIPYGEAVAGMLNSGAHYYLRSAGYENDMQHFALMEDLPLENIYTPTLIIHGIADTDVPFDNARLLAQRLPHAHLLALRGDHGAFYSNAATVMPQIQSFLFDN